MPFTKQDCLRECVLKLLVSETGLSAPEERAEDRIVVNEWIWRLNIEGPELARIKSLLELDHISDFERRLIEDELAICLKNEACRQETENLVHGMEKRFDFLSKLEKRFLEILRSRMTNKISADLIERLMQRIQIPRTHAAD